MATDGIYLGGGIPAGVYKKLAEGTTVTSYLNKGRLSHFVENTPLYVILDEHAKQIKKGGTKGLPFYLKQQFVNDDSRFNHVHKSLSLRRTIERKISSHTFENPVIDKARLIILAVALVAEAVLRSVHLLIRA